METNTPLIALMGNPNSGKTAIFNLLTGMNQKVSNYPGITVEKRKGTTLLDQNTQAEILDMPGTYSLTPESLDERIVAQQVLEWIHGEDKIKAHQELFYKHTSDFLLRHKEKLSNIA